ncbi:MAG TPA: hypothetical protein VKU80_09235 [Planctomycetota bacterium]|nr:hypothetical protein [Planctomycetota bacterium]
MKTMRDRSLASDTGTTSYRRRRARRGVRGRSELDHLLRVHSGSLTFLGLTLGVFVSRKFFVIPLAVAVSIAQEFAKERFLEKPAAPAWTRAGT